MLAYTYGRGREKFFWGAEIYQNFFLLWLVLYGFLLFCLFGVMPSRLSTQAGRKPEGGVIVMYAMHDNHAHV